MSIVVVFENRTSTLTFSNILKSMHIPSRVINTPRNITTNCGLSVETDIRYLNVIINTINSNRLQAFNGIYKLIISKGVRKYIRIR